jgi:UDP-2,3-diacylglucosamine hydrolase
VKYYFAADVHLGLPPENQSRDRERRFVNWLDSIKHDATEIFLLGDIFDFWFEYKKVVPKGFVRTLAKIAELTDAGIPVHIFAGNHDLWMRDYLPAETGATVHQNDCIEQLDGRKIYLSHGDDLDKTNKTRRLLRAIFTNRVLQKLYSAIHPFWGLAFAHAWSKSNRAKHQQISEQQFERLYGYVHRIAEIENLDIMIIGHIHCPKLIVENGFEFISLPDWFESGGGAVLDNGKLTMIDLRF